ncbi:CotH kinase family protein, partial [Akkermansiaceae bacterium]|nr:CotH kinase family protein [Akkermansiaceae bacterium]
GWNDGALHPRRVQPDGSFPPNRRPDRDQFHHNSAGHCGKGRLSPFSNGDPCGTFPLPDPLDRFWKRLASVEYIDPTVPGAYVQENAEIAISGATSRNFRTNEKHSLRLRFRSRDSVEGKAEVESADFKFPFVEAERKRFNQLMLRNRYQDSWTAKGDSVVYAGGLPAYRPLRGSATYIRDAWAREMHRRMNPPPAPPFAQGESGLTGNPIANRRWVHLYINGLYWGVYELGERIDEGYGRYHENPMADFDVLKPFLPLRCSPNPEEPKYIDEVDGSVGGWDQMIEACRATVVLNDDPLLLAEFTDKIGLNNYIDYLIINMFMHNTDWDGNNNWRALRNRDNGKFKFLVWDAELTMNPDRIFEDMTSGVAPTGYTQGQHLIPHTLMTATNPESAHPEYLAAFKARVALHFETSGGVFSVDGDTHAASQIFQETMDQFETVRLSEWARWGDVREFDHPDYPYSPGDWEQTAGGLRDGFVRDRRAIFLSQLRARGLAN